MPYMLSPSTLNVFSDCPRCFFLQFKKNFKRPEGIFPTLPSGMDRILKEYYDSCMEKGILPKELHDVDAKLFSDKVKLNKWRDYRQGIVWKDQKGNVIRGAIDNLLEKDGKLIVLDYKTRGYEVAEDTHEHYRDQLDIYNLVFRKNGIDTEDYCYLIFYHPDKIVDNVFLFHTKLVKMKVDVERAEKLINKALETLEGPMPKASSHCDYCKYREAKIELSLIDF